MTHKNLKLNLRWLFALALLSLILGCSEEKNIPVNQTQQEESIRHTLKPIVGDAVIGEIRVIENLNNTEEDFACANVDQKTFYLNRAIGSEYWQVYRAEDLDIQACIDSLLNQKNPHAI